MRRANACLCRHTSGKGVVRIAGKDYYCGKFELPESRAKNELLLAEYLANKNSFVAGKSTKAVAPGVHTRLPGVRSRDLRLARVQQH